MFKLSSSPAFKSSFPILLTTLINKIGAMGLSLLPALLIDHHFSTNDSSWIMGLVKSAAFAGTLLGGIVADHLGTKKGIILSFVLSGIGLGLLPFQLSMFMICALAILAQTGQAMYSGLWRILLADTVPPAYERESIGWLRMTSNFGEIFSYGIGWLFLGSITGLMIYDSATSFIAVVGCLALIPASIKPRGHEKVQVQESRDLKGTFSVWVPLIAVLILAIAFNVFYEIFITGSAIRFKLQFGADGISYFSRAMVLNTSLCALLSVLAARYLHNAKVVLPISLAVVGGSCLALFSHQSSHLLIAMFTFTLGEICFSAVSGYVIYQLIPPARKRGQVYGYLLLLQRVGSVIGASLAFRVFG